MPTRARRRQLEECADLFLTEERAGADPADAEKTDESRSSMFARLVRSIRLQGGPYASSARIELDPPELGRMRIDVRVAGDEVRIGVRTESSAAAIC